jgi:hypothetical protein
VLDIPPQLRISPFGSALNPQKVFDNDEFHLLARLTNANFFKVEKSRRLPDGKRSRVCVIGEAILKNRDVLMSTAHRIVKAARVHINVERRGDENRPLCFIGVTPEGEAIAAITKDLLGFDRPEITYRTMKKVPGNMERHMWTDGEPRNDHERYITVSATLDVEKILAMRERLYQDGFERGKMLHISLLDPQDGSAEKLVAAGIPEPIIVFKQHHLLLVLVCMALEGN